MNLSAKISIGEFFDKLTILEIKSERIRDPAKLANIHRELDMLRRAWSELPALEDDLAAELKALKQINERLWQIEVEIRDMESAGSFGERFIQLARSVYLTNDERAAVKRRINLKAGSDLIEEKSYADYQKRGQVS